jgi:hypothetical protein
VIDSVLRGLTKRTALPIGSHDRRVAVHPHEPLRRRQEDDRIVTTPAVRVLVRHGLAMPQPRTRLERLLHVRVGVEHTLTAEQLDVVQEVAGRTDGRIDVEPVLHPGQEIVRTMARRRVDGTCALLERHVLGEHAH